MAGLLRNRRVVASKARDQRRIDAARRRFVADDRAAAVAGGGIVEIIGDAGPVIVAEAERARDRPADPDGAARRRLDDDVMALLLEPLGEEEGRVGEFAGADDAQRRAGRESAGGSGKANGPVAPSRPKSAAGIVPNAPAGGGAPRQLGRRRPRLPAQRSAEQADAAAPASACAPASRRRPTSR